MRDFGVGQGGETGASPQRAVTVEPTPANAKRPRRPEGFRGQGHLAALLLSRRPLRVSSFVAPCHLTFPTKTGPLPIFRQALSGAGRPGHLGLLGEQDVSPDFAEAFALDGAALHESVFLP